MTDINTHGLECDFGKHKGERYTRIPVQYLRWMANTLEDERRDIARAELNRRGTVMPDIEASGHAIDRASLQCWRVYKLTRNDNEGLHAWLLRVGMDAYRNGKKLKSGKIIHMGMKFVFEDGEEFPVIKTVMLGTKRQQELGGVLGPDIKLP